MSLLSHFYLKLGGADAPAELMADLGNVEVDDSLHIPDMFTLQVRDPRFQWGDSDLLRVGQEVEILAVASEGGAPKRLLIGEITGVEPEYPYNGVPLLMVRGYDRAHRLHRGKKTRSFQQVTDSDMVMRIAREYGLRPDVDATTDVYEYILQNNQTDFEFVQERARRIGYTFLVDDRALVFKKPANMPAEVVELEYGVTLRQFRPRMTTASQYKEVIVKGWDPVAKREIVAQARPGGGGSSPGGAGPLGALGDTANSALGAAMGTANSAMQAGANQLNRLAQQAMTTAESKLNAAQSEAVGALPPQLRGPAQQLAERGKQAAKAKASQLAQEYLGDTGAQIINAIGSGNAADIAQIGMELGAGLVEKAFGEAGTLVVTHHPVRTQAEAEALARTIAAELAGGNVQAEGVAVGNPKLTAGCKVKLTALGKFSGEYFVSHTRHLYDGEDGYLTEFSISGRNPDTFTDLLTGGAGTNPGESGPTGPAGVVVGIVTNNQDPQGQGRVKVKFPWLSDQDESHWARVAMPMAGKNRGLFILPEVDDEVLVMFEHGDINHPYVIGSLWNGSDAPPLSATDAVSGGQVVRRVWQTRTGHTILLDDSDASPGIYITDQTGKNKISLKSQNNELLVEIQGDVKLTTKGKVEVQAQLDVNVESQTQLTLKGSAGVTIESSGSVKVKGAIIELN